VYVLGRTVVSNALWRDVVTALKEIEENTLVEKIRCKYIKSTSKFDE